jgi:hypothetical protein
VVRAIDSKHDVQREALVPDGAGVEPLFHAVKGGMGRDLHPRLRTDENWHLHERPGNQPLFFLRGR